MDEYADLFTNLTLELKDEKRASLSLQLEGEGRFNYFKGEHDIRSLENSWKTWNTYLRVI